MWFLTFCCIFVPWLHTWLYTCLGYIPWLHTYLGYIHTLVTYIPWLHTYLGYIPWLHTWLYTLVKYLGYVPWLRALVTYLGYIPWLQCFQCEIDGKKSHFKYLVNVPMQSIFNQNYLHHWLILYTVVHVHCLRFSKFTRLYFVHKTRETFMKHRGANFYVF